MEKKGTLLHCWWECKLVQALWKTVWRFFIKLKIELPYDPGIPLLGIYLEKSLFFFFLRRIYLFNWRIITLQYCDVFAIHRHELAMDEHVSPILNPLPHLPPHPIPLSWPRPPALSALLHALNLHWSSMLHMVIYVPMLFSQIIPPSPSPTQSKSLFFTPVSLLLPCI